MTNFHKYTALLILLVALGLPLWQLWQARGSEQTSRTQATVLLWRGAQAALLFVLTVLTIEAWSPVALQAAFMQGLLDSTPWLDSALLAATTASGTCMTVWAEQLEGNADFGAHP